MINICPFGLVSQMRFELTRISATVFETVSYTDSDTVTCVLCSNQLSVFYFTSDISSKHHEEV